MNKETQVRYTEGLHLPRHICILSLAHAGYKTVGGEGRKPLLALPEEKLRMLCSTMCGVRFISHCQCKLPCPHWITFCKGQNLPMVEGFSSRWQTLDLPSPPLPSFILFPCLPGLRSVI